MNNAAEKPHSSKGFTIRSRCDFDAFFLGGTPRWDPKNMAGVIFEETTMLCWLKDM